MNVEDVKASLDKLHTLSPKLNTATDEASAVVAAVEEFLNNCSIGLHVSVCVSEEPSEERETYLEDQFTPVHKSFVTWLAYRRLAGTFRIAVEVDRRLYSIYGTDADDQWTTEFVSARAWSSAPRDVKLQAFPHLPNLLSRLADELGEGVEETIATAKTVKEILTALGKK